ncbi:MAG: flagellar hook-length control protein FliK, partial [Hydrogenovibrio sp.]|nr:flagellar hook-length control protein FliK [Hydrogenovibrio sp.]
QPLVEMSLDIRKVSGQHAQVWETLITLEMENGTLVSKCILQDDTYSFQFWTESPQLEQSLRDHLPLFEAQLRQSGLKVRHLSITQHQPQATKTATKVALIDITV